MTGRRRILGLALIALAVPFPALALDGEPGGGPAPASLSVFASLDRCGTAEARVLCKIDAGWSGIEDADHYKLSVIGADGSIIDYGQTTGQSTSLYVPYVGPGTYSVRVSAWGTPPGDEAPELIAREVARSSGTARMASGAATEKAAGEGAEAGQADEPGGEPADPVTRDGAGPASSDPGPEASDATNCEEPDDCP